MICGTCKHLMRSVNDAELVGQKKLCAKLRIYVRDGSKSCDEHEKKDEVIALGKTVGKSKKS